MEDRSGCLRREPAERQPGGVLSGRNHSFDGHRTGQITGQRNLGVDEKIGVPDGRMVVRRVRTICLGMVRIDAKPAQ